MCLRLRLALVLLEERRALAREDRSRAASGLHVTQPMWCAERVISVIANNEAIAKHELREPRVAAPALGDCLSGEGAFSHSSSPVYRSYSPLLISADHSGQTGRGPTPRDAAGDSGRDRTNGTTIRMKKHQLFVLHVQIIGSHRGLAVSWGRKIGPRIDGFGQAKSLALPIFKTPREGEGCFAEGKDARE